MNKLATPFVHVLLFECNKCACPIPSALTSDHRNMEHIDLQTINVHCSCGWSAKVPAIEAKRHWVDFWSRRDGNS